ncbi:glycosyltransferase family 2 protein [Enterococcus sp. JM9B]|uniref:glycosyltransferase family 2 protein n=1 Tax=Enterococcus sp. JM9B TaxID=1857216 RepID=UPI001374F79E|nr:glycosyltransferase family 2 protein [Enterococcus sp. JM9B]KAF1304832.1 glycosyl transferase family 2 [Enterococcus sp. JM9B]
MKNNVREKKILLIIPAYNEEESILATIKKIKEFRKESQYNFDYIVINDGSSDGTESLLKENSVNTITLTTNLGIGGAVQTGYKYAKEQDYDIAIQFDGDGQHDINSLENLLEPIFNGEANLTVGSRFIKTSTSTFQTSFMRRLGIKILSFFIKLVTHKKVYDTTSGYRAVDKNIINYFSERYPIKYPEPESIVHVLKRGYKVKEVPVNMFERIGGESSITPIKSVRYMLDVCSAILVSALMKEND